MSFSDFEIGSALIDQVIKAIPEGRSERNVRTVISRPMWRAWCRFIGVPQDSKPTEWQGSKNTISVHGSVTVVVDADGMWARSEPIRPPVTVHLGFDATAFKKGLATMSEILNQSTATPSDGRGA